MNKINKWVKSLNRTEVFILLMISLVLCVSGNILHRTYKSNLLQNKLTECKEIINSDRYSDYGDCMDEARKI